MKKLIIFTSLFVLFLVFLMPGVLASLLRMVPANIQPGFDSDIRLSIYKLRDYTQYFVSKNPNLTAIGTSIRNPNLNNRTDIILTLYDKEGVAVRSATLNGFNVEDGGFVKFVFDPISDSKDKEYSFNISSPGAGPEETIEVFILNTKDEPSGITEYVYQEEVHEGGVPMVLFNKPVSKLDTLKSVYSSWLSRLLSLD